MKEIEIINDDGSKTIKVYSTYSDAQKRATAKYRSNNKEKLNEQRKRYYQCRKQRDENFLAYKREKAKEYYQRKKLLKQNSLNTTELPETLEPIISKVEEVNIEDPLEELLDEILFIETPVIDETITEKKKRRKSNKK
jgi:hypothetical protein